MAKLIQVKENTMDSDFPVMRDKLELDITASKESMTPILQHKKPETEYQFMETENGSVTHPLLNKPENEEHLKEKKITENRSVTYPLQHKESEKEQFMETKIIENGSVTHPHKESKKEQFTETKIIENGSVTHPHKESEKEQFTETKIIENGSVTHPHKESEKEQFTETKITENGSARHPLLKMPKKEQYVGKGFEVVADIPLTKKDKLMLTALLMFIFSSFGVAILLTAFFNKH